MPAHGKTKAEKNAIRLLKKGYTAKAAAGHDSVQVHPTTVSRWAKKHGIKLKFPHNRHKLRVDLVDKGEILRLRKRRLSSGARAFTIADIAELCDCSQSYVKKICAEARKAGKL